MKSPRFSVVVPTYNRASTMQETLDSCWQQTFEDFEVILVDDGSTDDTESVARSISDPRLRYVHQNNGGPAKARNHAIELARGDYIAYLDSDDVWFSQHLANADAQVRESGADFLYSQIIVDRGVGRYWLKPTRPIGEEEAIFDYLYVHGGFIQTSTVVVSKALTKLVRWDESLTFGDNDQYAIDMCKAGAKPFMLPRSQTLYADHMSPDALSQLPIFSGHSAKHTNFLDWMSQQRSAMSEQAQIAFAARYQSVALARKSPLQSLSLIWRAYRVNAMSITGAARQVLQSFFPRFYRRLIDQFVRIRGATDTVEKAKL